MTGAVISSKHHVVIPDEVMKEAGFKSGQKVLFVVKGGVVHIVPEIPFDKLRGILKGMDTSDIRDHEDRY